MSVIDISVAMQHLRADDADTDLVHLQLEAAERAAMSFLNRRFFASQAELDEARSLTLERLRAARQRNIEQVTAADAQDDEGIRCRLMDHARQVLADAYEEVDSIAYGMVVNPAIVAACLLKLGHLYGNREDVVINATATELPQASKALLMPFRTRMGV